MKDESLLVQWFSGTQQQGTHPASWKAGDSSLQYGGNSNHIYFLGLSIPITQQRGLLYPTLRRHILNFDPNWMKHSLCNFKACISTEKQIKNYPHCPNLPTFPSDTLDFFHWLLQLLNSQPCCSYYTCTTNFQLLSFLNWGQQVGVLDKVRLFFYHLLIWCCRYLELPIPVPTTVHENTVSLMAQFASSCASKSAGEKQYSLVTVPYKTTITSTWLLFSVLNLTLLLMYVYLVVQLLAVK